MVFIQKIVFGENCIKKLQFKPFCFLTKSVFLRRKHSKTKGQPFKYFLMGLLSKPFNKLPCNVPSFHLDFGPSFDGVTIKNNFADIKGKRSFGSR